MEDLRKRLCNSSLDFEAYQELVGHLKQHLHRQSSAVTSSWRAKKAKVSAEGQGRRGQGKGYHLIDGIIVDYKDRAIVNRNRLATTQERALKIRGTTRESSGKKSKGEREETEAGKERQTKKELKFKCQSKERTQGR